MFGAFYFGFGTYGQAFGTSQVGFFAVEFAVCFFLLCAGNFTSNAYFFGFCTTRTHKSTEFVFNAGAFEFDFGDEFDAMFFCIGLGLDTEESDRSDEDEKFFH